MYVGVKTYDVDMYTHTYKARVQPLLLFIGRQSFSLLRRISHLPSSSGWQTSLLQGSHSLNLPALGFQAHVSTSSFSFSFPLPLF